MNVAVPAAVEVGSRVPRCRKPGQAILRQWLPPRSLLSSREAMLDRATVKKVVVLKQGSACVAREMLTLAISASTGSFAA